MGDWTYYLFSITFSNADKILKFAHTVNSRNDLDHFIQRELTKRSVEIKNYLFNQPQRLFGSLICASFGENIAFKPTNGAFGHIAITQDSKIYVLDGQHRLDAIKKAISSDPETFKKDHVAILLVEHGTDDAGYRRARRLFTTVNRYAKQTSKATNRVMDEDDGNSFMLLSFIREFAFYSKHIKASKRKRDGSLVLAQSESMGVGDSAYLMSVSSFYEVIYNLVPAEHKKLFEHSRKQKLPDPDILDEVYFAIDVLLDEMSSVIRPWKDLKSGAIKDLAAYRTKIDGHPLVRPVCIIPFAAVFAEARAQGKGLPEIEAIVEKYSNITAKPWNGVLWDPSRSRMHGGQEVKRLTRRIWRLLLGLSSATEKASTIAEWKSRVDPQNSDPSLVSPLLP